MWNAKYVRRADYLKYYQTAKTYLQMVVDNPGSAHLITTDERGANYNNPFQRNFQYNMDLQVSPGIIIRNRRNTGHSFPNALMHSAAHQVEAVQMLSPVKAYGQSRMFAASFYYGDYASTATLRRDANGCSNGKLRVLLPRRLLSFAPGLPKPGRICPIINGTKAGWPHPYTAAATISRV